MGKGGGKISGWKSSGIRSRGELRQEEFKAQKKEHGAKRKDAGEHMKESKV